LFGDDFAPAYGQAVKDVTGAAKGAATKMAKAVKGVKSVDNKHAIGKPAKKAKKSANKK